MNEEIRNNEEIKEEELEDVNGGVILAGLNPQLYAATLENRGDDKTAVTLPHLMGGEESMFATTLDRRINDDLRPLPQKFTL